jgi:CubicO group peptidase (beta-lactamase class C family)
VPGVALPCFATDAADVAPPVAFGPARAVLLGGMDTAVAPGAVVAVRVHGKLVWLEAFGLAAVEPEPRPMHVTTSFDLASLTKPLATATAVLRLVQEGLVALDDPVGRYLPAFATSAQTGLTVRRLLSHSSGMPGWRPTYAWARTRPQVLAFLASLPPAYPAGTRVEYSCLGYILLGLLVEACTGLRLDEFFSRSVYGPLGLGSLGYGQRRPAEQYASSERGNVHERALLERAGVVFEGWRSSFYPGQPNDGNAYYALDGVSGNAGLFGSAADVAALGQLWLDGGIHAGARVLAPEVVALATRDQTPGLNAPKGLGWFLNRRSAPLAEELMPARSNSAYLPAAAFTSPWQPRSCGELLSDRAFGHIGFTGTSLWIDPARSLVVALLTNRIHPSVGDAGALASLRARYHNALAAVLPLYSGVS